MCDEGFSENVDWAACGRPLPPNPVSGDVHAVVESRLGCLIAVADGLGHGSVAAECAARAIAAVKQKADQPLDEILIHCHHEISGSRGVALSLARVDGLADELSWCAVGDVSGTVFSPGDPPARTALLGRPGVVGYQLPALRVSRLRFNADDLLVMASDGIKAGFAQAVSTGRAPAATARSLLSEWSDEHDDALVVVVSRRA